MAKPYRYPLTKQNGYFRPFVPLYIVHPKEQTKGLGIDCLIDSGADQCLMPGFIAKQLGYDIVKDAIRQEKTKGVMGAELNVYVHKVMIKLLEPSRKSVIWTSKEIEMRFADHDKIPVLLGTSDFLIHFACTFNFTSVTGKHLILQV